MNGEEYEAWVLASGNDPATARTSLSTLRRIEAAYGDLDELYDRDRCEHLFRELTYDSNDSRTGAPNPSKIPIRGNLYNSLASLRTHLTKYARFRDELADGDAGTLLVEGTTFERQRSADATFSLERDLQAALRRSIEQLEPDLQIVDGGGEYVVPSGRIDILCRDRDEIPVVIELKSVLAGRDAVGQTLAYMGDIADSEPGGRVRGILVAPEFDPRAEAAARVVHTLQLVEYTFNFSFSAVG